MIQETLTKENFWNEIYSLYPNAAKLFCDWIDEYKKSVNWHKLFNSDSDFQDANGKNAPAPKFHELPYAIQQGIWIEFALLTRKECLDENYVYCGELKEDIRTVLQDFEFRHTEYLKTN